jgi:aryl-alcohol dehydrogenase-like predicted oxidoreductase
VFLQGALLMDPAELPAHLRSLGSRLSRFQSAIAAAGMAPLAAALAFARSAAPADRLIIGVNSIAELRQVAAAFGSSVPPGLDFAQFASEDLDMIDPRRWPIIH